MTVHMIHKKYTAINMINAYKMSINTQEEDTLAEEHGNPPVSQSDIKYTTKQL